MKGDYLKMKNNQDNTKCETSGNTNKVQSGQNDADEDADIDLSEIPEWTEEMFKKARGLDIIIFHPELKDRINKIND